MISVRACCCAGVVMRVMATNCRVSGFMVFTSFGLTAEITGNLTAQAITIDTAHTLALRFSPVVGCIESWGPYPLPTAGNFLVIIDNMMNLELLWWAAKVSGNSTFAAIATSHADHMLADIFQPFNPGCVWHMITYDAANGTVLARSSTPQGLGENTVWSRGQAWAVNGFTLAYRYSGLARYLEAAQSAADCFIRLLDASPYADSYIPLWDFNATSPDQYARDTSAAAIVADALVELATYTTDPVARATYVGATKKILNSLTTPPFSFIDRPSASQAFINNGTVTFPAAGIPLVYGDYYLLSALAKLGAL
jgi:unsaturated chondroitin disaccharide hydrolase